MNVLQTPCRPRARVAKAQAKGPGDRPQEWTASRCHRLLRPLKTRITSLRKDVHAQSHAAPSALAGDRAEGHPSKRPAEDCEWIVPRKRVRRTYSGRRANPPAHCPSDGEAGAPDKFAAAKTLATPLLRRARGQHVPSSPIQEPEGEPVRTTGRSAFELRLQSFQAELSPARYNDYEAVFKGLEALLQATRAEKRPRKGASSFMDMCLRKVPQHIAAVEAWDAAQAEEAKTKSMIKDSHTSFQIYTELESLGTSDHGWKHLRMVVRADALETIKDAMLEGLFTKEFSILLLDLCFACAATAEVEPVFAALLHRPFPLPSSPDATLSENDALLPLAYLCDAKRSPGRPSKSFLLRHCSDMLSKGCLPVEWLGTPNFERLWALANRGLSRKSATDAAHFIITAIALLCRKWRPGGRGMSQDLEQQATMAAVQNTLTSALAIQAAINILSESKSPARGHARSNCHRGVAHIRRTSKYILEASIAEVGPWGTRKDGPGGSLLGMAAFFSSSTPGDDQISLCVGKFIAAISSYQTGAKRDRTTCQYDAMVLLLASIARICGRVTPPRSCHDHLETLCGRLGRLGLPPGVLDGVNTAAALCLARQTNSLRDQIYAENLASNMPDASSAEGQDQGRDPQTRTMFAGYRWEDTIGEWVAAVASPAAAEGKRQPPAAGRRSSRLSNHNDDNDNSTCQDGTRNLNRALALPQKTSSRADGGSTRQKASSVPQPTTTRPYGTTARLDAVRVPEPPFDSHGGDNRAKSSAGRATTKLGDRASLGIRDTTKKTTVARRRSARRSFGKGGQDWPASSSKSVADAGATSHDELDDDDDDKENWNQKTQVPRKQSAAPYKKNKSRGVVVVPLSVVKRQPQQQVRLSGAQQHLGSDDELGI